MKLGKRRIALFLKLIIYMALLNLGVGVYIYYQPRCTKKCIYLRRDFIFEEIFKEAIQIYSEETYGDLRTIKVDELYVYNTLFNTIIARQKTS